MLILSKELLVSFSVLMLRRTKEINPQQNQKKPKKHQNYQNSDTKSSSPNHSAGKYDYEFCNSIAHRTYPWSQSEIQSASLKQILSIKLTQHLSPNKNFYPKIEKELSKKIRIKDIIMRCRIMS